MIYNPRFPTNVVAIIGTFGKKWLIQFQNRKKHQSEFLMDQFSCSECIFDTLESAFECAKSYQLNVVDVQLHRAHSTHSEIDQPMQEKIQKLRKEFSGTYVLRLS